MIHRPTFQFLRCNAVCIVFFARLLWLRMVCLWICFKLFKARRCWISSKDDLLCCPHYHEEIDDTSCSNFWLQVTVVRIYSPSQSVIFSFTKCGAISPVIFFFLQWHLWHPEGYKRRGEESRNVRQHGQLRRASLDVQHSQSGDDRSLIRRRHYLGFGKGP